MISKKYALNLGKLFFYSLTENESIHPDKMIEIELCLEILK
jgi:hypothetical protein